MERGIYFDAWFPRQHCYHPSLPPRRLRMVDDLVDYRATTLVWSALGGGSLSLPYLEEEAFREVSARDRFYGFVNDSEFIAACHERGIRVFGIVFEAQGWEFPVELNDDEDQVLALNELRGVGHRGWMGLREFSQDRYPKLWKSIDHYFPNGLYNSDGQRVDNLLEECCSRDIDGVACHAHWVECPDREHYCYYMDRNNPAWREYLKAVIRLQIDAGVDGIQLDEAELPLGALRYGGCFCKDCMKGFSRFLYENEVEGLPEDKDAASFDYAEFLRERGYDFKSNLPEVPLFWEYHRFQRTQITRHFRELADYAREYGRSIGREVLVSGNFFNLYPHYQPSVVDVDIVITEMRNTAYRQPEWYRYVAGFAGAKEVIVVENPYGGVVPEMVENLKDGRARDLFRLSLYEAAAMGANMAVSYGAWMGSRIEDAFYAPHDVASEVQQFLADNEGLFGKGTFNEVCVVFGVESNTQPITRKDAFADIVHNRSDEAVEVAFRDVSARLAEAGVPYDVLMFPDGHLAADTVSQRSLAPYRTVVLPGCSHLTDGQFDAIRDYLEDGGQVRVVGDLATNLPAGQATAILQHPGTKVVTAEDVDGLIGQRRQIASDVDAELAFNILETSEGQPALHVVNYGYDAAADEIETLKDLDLIVRLPEQRTQATVIRPGHEPADLEVTVDGDEHRVIIDEVGIYAAVVFHDGTSDHLRVPM